MPKKATKHHGQEQQAKRAPRVLRQAPQWIIDDPNRLIDIHELTHLAGSKAISTTYDWIADGILPKGIKLTPGSVRWRYGTVIEALAERATKAA